MKRSLIIIALGLLGIFPALADQPEWFSAYKVDRIDVKNAPVIDGKLDEAIWQNKAVIQNLRQFGQYTSGNPVSVPAEFIVLTDGAKIYIGAILHEPQMDKVLYNPGAQPYFNECIEAYFDSKHDGTEFFHFAVDVGNQRICDRASQAQWTSGVDKQAQSWTVELAIDCKSIFVDARPGGFCGFNICRFRQGVKPQELSSWTLNKEQRQKALPVWGHLLFGEEGRQYKDQQAVTRADIDRVFPQLGSGRVLVPVEGGFNVFTKEAEKVSTYSELLTLLLTDINGDYTQAKALAGSLQQDDARVIDLQKKLADLDRQLSTSKREVETVKFTQRSYEDYSLRYAAVKVTSADLFWRAKLLDLITDVVAAK